MPLREDFTNRGGLCRGGNCLELLLEPYEATLRELVTANVQQGEHMSAHLLWEVLTAVVKYLGYLQEKEENPPAITYDQILVLKGEKVKIVPVELTQGCGLPLS